MKDITITGILVPVLLVVAHLCAWAAPCELSAEFSTANGAVIGCKGRNVTVFRGIPFAGDTGGSNRWRQAPPAPVWRTPLHCTQFGPSCPTHDSELDYTIMSEDCLNLNVYVPTDPAAANLPVLFFIHGGGYWAGTASQFWYNATSLVEASDGTIIVVTANYRLGSLGFLCTHETISQGTSNLGLMDQQRALRWVQDNIGNFGGDSNRVTVFGESAGAGSVQLHLFMPSSWDLFHQAILDSTWLTVFPSLTDMASYGHDLIKMAGCGGTGNALECMRQLPWQNVSFPVEAPTPLIGPSVDGNLIPDQIPVLLKTGRFKQVPVILGSNANEGNLFAYVDSGSISEMTEDEFTYGLQDNFGPYNLESFVIELYADILDQDKQAHARWEAYSQSTGDFGVSCNTGYLASAFARYMPVYRYYWRKRPDNQIGTYLGATHTVDLMYIFGFELNSTSDLELSQIVRSYYTEFVLTGSPGSANGMEQWPRANERLLVFDLPISSTEVASYDTLYCDRWVHYYDSYASIGSSSVLSTSASAMAPPSGLQMPTSLPAPTVPISPPSFHTFSNIVSCATGANVDHCFVIVMCMMSILCHVVTLTM